MPTSKSRLQVILGDEATDTVKQLAQERGLSVSAMLSQLVHAALQLQEFKPKPDLSVYHDQAVKAAIAGSDIGDMKLATLLEIVEQFKDR